MSLKEKAHKNYEILEYLSEEKYYNILANRAYYSLFQLMKYILKNEVNRGRFNYDKFNVKMKKKSDLNYVPKEYAHKYIEKAFMEWLMNNNKKYNIHRTTIQRFLEIEELRSNRIKADYEETKICKQKSKDIMNITEDIHNIINKHEIYKYN